MSSMKINKDMIEKIKRAYPGQKIMFCGNILGEEETIEPSCPVCGADLEIVYVRQRNGEYIRCSRIQSPCPIAKLGLMTSWQFTTVLSDYLRISVMKANYPKTEPPSEPLDEPLDSTPK